MSQSLIRSCLQGESCEAYRVFGAHFTHEYEQDGVRFTVYAPNARAVSLIGSFNDWNEYEMFRAEDGTFSIFAANLPEGALYKFRITTQSGEKHDRIDPFAFFSELRPNTASVLCQMDGYDWQDASWMQTRQKNFNAPMNIYELHAGSWKRPFAEEIFFSEPTNHPPFYNYEELADLLIPYLKENGYTHLEFLPLAEHPFDGSWGYQLTGYFSATSRYGSPKQLMYLVDRCHQAGIGVIIDFVPAHFVTDFYALHQYDGGYLYESEFDHQRFSQWQTALFDFTKPYVISFLKSALNFWITYYHVDGVRFDAVANLIYHHGMPENGLNESGIWFLKNLNYTIKNRHPDVMLIAEDSSSFLKVTAPVIYGGLGFDYKWNLGWMHDILEYLALPPQQRSVAHHQLTHSISYFYSEIYLLPFSHDEVVHGKKTIVDKLYGSYEEKFSQLRLLYLYMYAHPGKKLNFMGNELAEFREWDENQQLSWNLLTYPAHHSFHQFLQQLHQLYLSSPALYAADYHPDGFEWLDANNCTQSVITFRRSNLMGEEIIAIFNFSAHFYPQYSFCLEQNKTYELLFHTDDIRFGGKTSVNQQSYFPQHNTISLALPPFSGLLLQKQQL